MASAASRILSSGNDDWVEVERILAQKFEAGIDINEEEQEAAENAYYDYVAMSAVDVLQEGPIFTTDIPKGELWSHFLTKLPPILRERFSCYMCRQFMNNCGPLLKIDEKGNVTPFLWGRDSVDEKVP
jgi:hypothetical protein